MRVLALNCGSSSLKAAVLDSVRNERLFDCRVQKIEPDAVAALQPMLDDLRQRAISPEAVAHRIVHGGERFLRATRIDAAVLAEIEALQGLAPLHNPPAVAALRAARAAYPDVPHIAVFDTAFHATLPRRAREYALPVGLRTRFGIRRFGFHGISHSHVMECVAAYMRAPATTLRVISCHLGNGASVAALEYGRSIETSMGMTPLEGLVMGTRAGDIDPGALLHLLHSGELDVQQLDEVLNERSGLMGLAGTNDMSEVERRAAEGDEACRLAIALYSHRVRKYIGAYAAVMGGVDAIAFTGGVGENSALIRHRCLQRLEFLGALLDEDKNREIRVDARTACGEICVDRARTRLFVVRADEELVMAREAAALLTRARAPVGKKIPIAVSARHAHLTQRAIDSLFGPGYRLTRRTALKQPGQFAAQETVALIGPRGRIDGVRMMGPPRAHDQVEISRKIGRAHV